MNNIKPRQNSLVTNILNSTNKHALDAKNIHHKLGEINSFLHITFVIEQLYIAGLLDVEDGNRYITTDAGRLFNSDKNTICCV